MFTAVINVDVSHIKAILQSKFEALSRSANNIYLQTSISSSCSLFITANIHCGGRWCAAYYMFSKEHWNNKIPQKTKLMKLKEVAYSRGREKSDTESVNHREK